MNRHSWGIKLLLLSVFIGLQIGCDRTSQQNHPSATRQIDFVPDVAPHVEYVELSVESITDEAVTGNKKAVTEAQKGGKSNIAGTLDGTEWLKLDVFSQLTYLRGLGDSLEFMDHVYVGSYRALARERNTRALEYTNGDNSFRAGGDVTGAFRSRVMDVIAGRTFGDLTSAITQFYQRKPLLKDKPVLWVLAIPLYKEIQESRSKPQPGSVDEAIEQGKDKVAVTMVKKK